MPDFKPRLLNNKLITGIALLFAGSLLSWVIWVTTCTFEARGEERTAQVYREEVKEKLNRSEQVNKEVQKDLKEIRQEISENQKEMLKLLLDIKKEVKDNKK